MGLGDTIICNALIRNICKKYEHVTIFSKPKYLESTRFMFRDIKNLQILSMDDNDVGSFLYNIPNTEKYYVGHENILNLLTTNTFDECFYRQIGLDFQKRWDHYFVERDLKLEEETFEKFAPTSSYAFIHDDHERSFFIDESLVKKDLLIFRPPKTTNIFSLLKIIEHASEIHCMDSCFKHIIDSMDIKHNNLFYHMYIRGINNSGYTQSKLNWKKIF